MRGRQPLGPIPRRERDKVGDLLPLKVNDFDQLACAGNKRRAVTSGNEDVLHRWIRCHTVHPGNAFVGHDQDCASYITLGQASIQAERPINGYGLRPSIAPCRVRKASIGSLGTRLPDQPFPGHVVVASVALSAMTRSAAASKSAVFSK